MSLDTSSLSSWALESRCCTGVAARASTFWRFARHLLALQHRWLWPMLHNAMASPSLAFTFDYWLSIYLKQTLIQQICELTDRAFSWLAAFPKMHFLWNKFLIWDQNFNFSKSALSQVVFIRRLHLFASKKRNYLNAVISMKTVLKPLLYSIDAVLDKNPSKYPFFCIF